MTLQPHVTPHNQKHILLNQKDGSSSQCYYKDESVNLLVHTLSPTGGLIKNT